MAYNAEDEKRRNPQSYSTLRFTFLSDPWLQKTGGWYVNIDVCVILNRGVSDNSLQSEPLRSGCPAETGAEKKTAGVDVCLVLSCSISRKRHSANLLGHIR